MYTHISISLSLDIYIYIYTHVHMYTIQALLQWVHSLGIGWTCRKGRRGPNTTHHKQYLNKQAQMKKNITISNDDVIHNTHTHIDKSTLDKNTQLKQNSFRFIYIDNEILTAHISYIHPKT